MLDCLNVPALGLGLTMVGFGAMASEAGIELLPTLSITAFVWGIAGQVALVEIHKSEGALLTLFIAVALANLRMLPMSVTGVSAVLAGRPMSFLGRILLMQTMAISCWVQMTTRSDHVPGPQRLPYYLAFAATLITSGLIGTTVGHQMGRVVPPDVMTVAIFMTPLYLLLLVCGARQWVNRLSVLFGVLVGIGFYPLIGDWSVVVAGLLGGTLAFLAAPRLFKAEED